MRGALSVSAPDEPKKVTRKPKKVTKAKPKLKQKE
jgi:hypothetical protein